MGIFFVYILKSSVCLALFYLFYRLLLSKETFHRFNRLALLGVLVLSCAIPFVEVTIQKQVEASISFDEIMLMAEATPFEVLEETSAPFPWRALVLLAYGLGIVFFLARHLWSLGRMCRLLRASRREKMAEGIVLFVHNEKVAPFSWMNMIVLSEEDILENGDAILTHERAHIKNRHSWDLLLAEACIFIQWFNPAAWLLKQELQTLHEYEADEWVINNGIDAKTYQLLIIKKAVGARLYSIANSFNHSSLKKRITMMIKKKSNPWARLKYLYVLPLAAIAVAAFARPEVSNEFNEISVTKVNDLVSVVKTIGAENEDSISKSNWYPAVPVENDTIERLVIKLEVGQKPLFVIDGVPFGTYLSLDDINAAMVESATLLDKTEAMKLYGEKAKDGALVITSKHPEKTKVHRDVKFTQGVPSSDEKFTLNGSVMDHKSLKPIAGASVIVRGTTNGTVSDSEGKFKLPVKIGDVVEVSYVGLRTTFGSVNTRKDLIIYMEEDAQQMEGMIVYAPDSSKSRKGEVVVFDMPIEEAMKGESSKVKYTEVKVEETEASQQEDVVFRVVEEMPQFPGGMQEAMTFLAKNVKYPVVAQQANIEGRVIVQFIVGKDGSISDVKTVRGVSPELDAEAMRVVSMMPKWIPGKQRGKAVAVKYTMPVSFRLHTPAPKSEEEKIDASQIHLKIDKGVSKENVDAVKHFLVQQKDGYKQIDMKFPQGVNKSVEELPTGGVRYRKVNTMSISIQDGIYPLIVVNGEVLGNGVHLLSKFAPEHIESLNMMKEEDAVAEFGDKAKDGAIKIVTKKK